MRRPKLTRYATTARTSCIAMIVLTGVSSLVSAAERPEPTKPGPEVQIAVEGNNQFAVDLYARLSREKTGNLFLSPYSISSALTMTYAGAAGETQQQMADVLHLRLPEQQLHAAQAALTQALQNDDKQRGFEVRIANRLWGQQDYGFLPEFLQTTERFYGAPLETVDFERQTEQARKTINAWVEKQTNDKIKDLLQPGVLDAMTRLVLTNAIYFNGTWENEFNPKATKDLPFHLSADRKAEVPTMFRRGKYPYREFEDLQVLELPYGKKELSMLVFLPKAVDGLPALEKRLTADALQMWSTGLQMREARVYLPRFRMTSEFSLADVLKTMGMPLPFDPNNADFSRMSTKEDLYVSAVIHKAFVDVNEKGTEAAAATGVAIGVTSAPLDPPPIVEFRADRPFLFLIRDNRTKSVLFLGRVVDPKS
jgi:serpin B